MCALDVFHFVPPNLCFLTLPSCSRKLYGLSVGFLLTSGIYWFGQWYPGDGRGKGKVMRVGIFFTWLLPFKVSSRSDVFLSQKS